MVCPYCQSLRVYRSNSFVVHVFRNVTDSNKRYCASCKKRWVSRYSGSVKHRLFGIGMVAVLCMAVFLGIRFADQKGAFKRGFSIRKSFNINKNFSKVEDEVLANRIEAGRLQRRAALIERLQKKKIQP